MTTFSDFGLAEPITRALSEERYLTPTPIQAQTIPLALERRDIVGIAQTGTGKTAAFALPILNQLSAAPRPPERKHCRVLVLSPTRELSGQILDSFRAYGRHMRLRSALAIGGVPMGRQVRALMDGVDILVATPGRLLDLVKGNALRLSGVEFLVLDEADRMLDMGFIRDIRTIVAKLPKQRQTLFFSATMPEAIATLADEMLTDPAKVSVTPVSSTAERINQRVIRVDRGAKPAMLADLLRNEPIDRVLVFTRTKHGADKLVRVLAKDGLTAEAIHGNKSQNNRERTLANFREGRIRTLIATDIAARGIDVDGVSHVINFDMPVEPESYVHRIGRTARAGAEGVAISLCAGDEASQLRAIERLIRMSIPATGEASAAASGPAGRPDGRDGQRSRHRNGQRPQQRERHAAGENGDGRQRQPQSKHPGQRRGDHPGQPKQAGRPQRAPNAARSGGRSDAPEDLASLGFMQRKPARPDRSRNGLAPQPR
ncbi:MAG TPA: DEAD/DEAH box helicase [Xanthobacteraceae bacterium]|nr:DEAD/DEAH box helicase [Xanthobacteraceae bacterium]